MCIPRAYETQTCVTYGRAHARIRDLFVCCRPVPPDEPVIDGGPEVLLNAGESYNLSCVSRGAKPPSMIEWLKDGLPVEGAVSNTVSWRHAYTHTRSV